VSENPELERLRLIEASENVEWFPGGTVLETHPDHVLGAAVGKLSQVLVVGRERETDALYVAISYAGGEAGLAMSLLLLERGKRFLVETAET
jgi:hypothetical protein